MRTTTKTKPLTKPKISHTSKCTLVCDTREKLVTRHTDELAGVPIEIKQITTGDYSVITPTGNILAIIERKSLDDYGASLKDGRHDNKEKLIMMREQTGCRIIYIIEGEAFPAPEKTFSRIAYKNIESSIFHLMIKHNISVIRTKDTLSTAQTLARFMRSMDTLYASMGDLSLERVETQAEATPETAEMPVVVTADATELLTQKHTRGEPEVVREMWSCFRGITVETASEYMRKWSVADIIRGRASRNDIETFRTANGRAISSLALRGLTEIPKTVEIRLLSAIPGVSQSVATVLLEKIRLSQLLSYGKEMSIEIINRDLGKNGKSRRLGDVLAERIVRHFNYKLVVDTKLVVAQPDVVITPVNILPIIPALPLPSPDVLSSIDDFLAELG